MMRGKRWMLAGMSVLVISGSAVGLIAAQDATPETPSAETEMTARGYLGVALDQTEDGVVIVAVVEGSAAADAGLQANDIIVSIDGEMVESARDAQRTIRELAAGDSVVLEVTRDGESVTIEATLTELPARLNVPRGGFRMGRDQAFTYDPETLEWTVAILSEDSALYEAGLREGDVITAVDGEARDVAALVQYIVSLEEGATVTLSVQREGESQDITVNAADLTMFNFRRGFFRDMLPDGEGFGLRGFAAGIRLGVAFEQSDEGATVTQVLEGAPAAEAGIEIGDIITAVNGEVVNEEITLRDRISAYEVGDEITLAITRDGESLDLTVTLTTPEMPFDMMPFFEGGFHGGRGFRDGRGGSPFNVPSSPVEITPPAAAANV
jgi:S1-C subfamily serine protease